MTTFQAAVYGVLYGITAFFPISERAHSEILPVLIGWQQASTQLFGFYHIAACCAALVYYRDDWASMIASTLGVIFFRKKPMTLDERLPLCLAASTIPPLLFQWYLTSTHQLPILGHNILQSAILMFCGGLPLRFLDGWARKSRGICDWTLSSAFFIGAIQCTACVPGWDRITAGICGALFLGFRMEIALKYTFFCAVPLLLSDALMELDGLQSETTLTCAVAVVVCFFASLLAIGSILNRGPRYIMLYRFIVALAGVLSVLQ